MNELLDHYHSLQEGARAIVTYLSQKKCPAAPERLVRELSRSPAYVKAWKEYSFRRLAVRVLALVRPYYPMIVEPALLTLGKPEQHENGSPFTKDDFENRSHSCLLPAKFLTIWTWRYELIGTTPTTRRLSW